MRLGRGFALVAGVLVGALLVIAAATHQAGVAVISTVSCDGYPAQTSPTVDGAVSGRLAVRVASWNALYDNPTRNVTDGIRTILKLADVVGVQELNSAARRDLVAHQLDQFGSVQDRSREMILWRRDRLDLLDHGSVKVFDRTRAEDGAAGPVLGPKYIQWVKLRQRATRAVFFVTNQHLIATVDRAGHPDRTRPRRVALADRQLAATEDLVDRLRTTGPVLGTGDFNIDARADATVQDPRWPSVRFARHWMATSWSTLGYPTTGTHGRRLIDYVWSTTDVMATRQQILPKHGSDHSPVIATLTDRRPTTHAGTTARGTVRTDTTTTAADGGDASGGNRVKGLSAAQVAVARQIFGTTVQVGRERGWSPAMTGKAFRIAAAVAMQESSLGANPASRHPDRNGDGGLYAQRTRPGWYGTIAQVNDPAYSTRAFLLGVPGAPAVLTGLVGVAGWQDLPLTVAAQRVQRSAFPAAYQRWAGLAAGLHTAFTSTDTAAASATIANAACTGTDGDGVDGVGDGAGCPVTGQPAEKLLTSDARLVLRCVAARFPQIETIGTYPGHDPDESRAVDIMIPDYTTPGGIEQGTRIAAWVKTHADQLGVMYVIWREHIWSPQRATEGWRACGGPAATCYTGPDDSAAHRNHVHVSVWGNRATGPTPTPTTTVPGAGGWVLPIAAGRYRVGCGFGCYPGHTGLDLPAADGTPVRAVTAGVVIRSQSITATGTCTALPICGTRRVSYGNLIVIAATGNPGTTIWYAHLSARRVRVGDHVTAGQVIGAVGYEGHVVPAGPRGAHLHLEIRQGGTPTNPLPVLRRHGLHP